MMTPPPNRSRYESKGLEVIALDSQLVMLEERDDPLDKQPRVVHYVDIHIAVLAFGADSAASEESNQILEDVSVILVLRHLEGGLDVPATGAPGQLVAMNRY
jgi:hypothetical protein